MRDDVVGAVIAGGSGARIGGPKGDLRIGGDSFLDLVVGMLRGSFAEVIVCGGDHAPAGTELVADPARGLGPLAGVASALNHANGRPVFVIAVDMPLVSRSTIDLMCNARLGLEQARIARVDRRAQPLSGIYSGQLIGLARMRLRSDDLSMMGFVRSVPHLTLVDITDGSLRNINTPEDLHELNAALTE